MKFTPAGGQVEICLERVDSHEPEDSSSPIAYRLSPPYAQITVSDTGKGINSQFLPHIFDYFRQEDSATTRVFGGLGLGLAIVRHLVELHGGMVQASSPGEGQGSTFVVRLPLIKDEEKLKDDPEQHFPSFNIYPSLQDQRVLVVDDDVDSRELISFVLEKAGAIVTSVSSAKEALQALNQLEDLDVLISDIGMPEVDGYMLMAHVRAQLPDSKKHIPAIALTAYAGN